MLVGSSEKAVMWGTSEPERGAQSRVWLKGEHQGEQEAGICWVRTRKMPGWPTLRGQGSQGHTGQVFAGPVDGSIKPGLFSLLEKKKNPRGHLCRRGKQSGSISHRVLGLTACKQSQGT